VISAIVITIAIRSSRREKPPLVVFLFDELIKSSLVDAGDLCRSLSSNRDCFESSGRSQGSYIYLNALQSWRAFIRVSGRHYAQVGDDCGHYVRASCVRYGLINRNTRFSESSVWV